MKTDRQLSASIKKALSVVRKLNPELSKARQTLEKDSIELFTRETGIKVGSLVTEGDKTISSYRWHIWKVTRIECYLEESYGNAPRIILHGARRKTKAGSFENHWEALYLHKPLAVTKEEAKAIPSKETVAKYNKHIRELEEKILGERK